MTSRFKVVPVAEFAAQVTEYELAEDRCWTDTDTDGNPGIEFENGYWVGRHLINTPLKVLAMVRHLAEKEWFDAPLIEVFIDCCASLNNWRWDWRLNPTGRVVETRKADPR